MHRTLPSLLLLVLLSLGLRAAPTHADPAGTLDQLVVELEAHLDRSLAGCVTPARPLRRQDLALRAHAGAGVSERLNRVVTELLKGKLAGKGLRSFTTLDASSRAAAEKLARSRGFELLLDLELVLVEGQLHLQGDLLATDRVLWRDLRHPERGALSHLHASVRADAEVRAFQGSLASTRTRYAHQSYPFGRLDVLDLGAGDIDGDGRAELVLLTPRTLEVLRHKSTGFVPLFRFSLTGTPAAVRPRRALGTLLVRDLDGDKRAEILARSSDLERGVELAFDGKGLTARRELDGYPLLVEENRARVPSTLLLGASVPGQDLFDAPTLTRAPSGAAASEWQQSLATTFYTLRSARVPGPQARSYVAAVDAAGQLSLLAADNRTPLLSLPRVGVAVDLCDLDDDGRLEVITTGGDGLDAEDQITVQRLQQPAKGPAQLRPLWRSASLGGQVVALAHGDLDGNGKLELVAAVRQKGQLLLMVIQ